MHIRKRQNGRQLRTARQLNIRSLRHLAQRLNLPIEILEEVARYIKLQYEPTKTRQKKDLKSFREINVPRPRLMQIQRKINRELLESLSLPDALHAYRRGRSTVTATAPHKGPRFFWLADIRRFYPSISNGKVYKVFIGLGCTPDVSHLLTQLTTLQHCLPQGAPTSPTLANLYLRLSGIADRLENLARDHGLRVTFFGDDIIVSGERPFSGLVDHFKKIVLSSGLELHPEKTGRMLGPDQRHFALGILLNSDGTHLNVSREYRRNLRHLLRLARKYGANALNEGGVTAAAPKAFLGGKISYAAYVNPANASLAEELDKIS